MITRLLGNKVISDGATIVSGATVNLDSGNASSYSGSGTDWFDLTDNNYDATLVNGVGYDAGDGGTLTFTLGIDYVSGNATPQVNSTDPFTIEIWFNLTDYSYAYPGMYMVKSDLGKCFYCFLTNVGGVYNLKSLAFGFGSAQTFKIGADTIIDGVWNHVIITKDTGYLASSNYDVYVNGIIQTKFNSSGGSLSNVNNIGIVGSSQYFKGKLPVFNLYNNKEFTQEEVTQNFDFYKDRFGL